MFYQYSDYLLRLKLTKEALIAVQVLQDIGIFSSPSR